MPEIAWIGVEYKGTTAYIKIVEKTKPEVLTDDNRKITTLQDNVTAHYFREVAGSYSLFDLNSKAGKFVFGEQQNPEYYCLATKGQYNYGEYVTYVVYVVYREAGGETTIDNWSPINSNGTTSLSGFRVRVVVELDKHISLKFNDITQKWEYN